MLRKFDFDLENTNWGFVLFMVATILPALGVVSQCAFQISQGRALEPYDLIIMDHPVLTSLGATYLEVLIGDAMILVALFVGLFLRHHYYRDERGFMKKYNIKGKTGFSRDFNVSGSNRDYSFDSDGGD